MTGKPPLIYWDTCPLIAWINGEMRPEFPGISRVVRAKEDRILRIATSVITFIEILPEDMKAGASEKLVQFQARPSYFPIQQVTSKVVELARHIRNESKKERGSALHTPDCIHLATAIINEATEFHTMDGNGRKPNKKLLPLSGTPLVESLKICLPEFVQPRETEDDQPELEY